MANQNHFLSLSSEAIVPIAARQGESSRLKSRNENAAIVLGNQPAIAAATTTVSSSLAAFASTPIVETVAVLSRKSASKSFIPVSISPKDMGLSEEKEQPTYANICDYVQKTHGMKVSSLYVAQMKAECGLETQADRSGDKKQPKCPPEKREAILDAFRHFGLIGEDGTEK